jgi:hypothetical protein
MGKTYWLLASRVADPFHFGSDPAIFVSDLHNCNKKLFYTYFFLKLHFYHFSKISSHKEVTKQ